MPQLKFQYVSILSLAKERLPLKYYFMKSLSSFPTNALLIYAIDFSRNAPLYYSIIEDFSRGAFYCVYRRVVADYALNDIANR